MGGKGRPRINRKFEKGQVVKKKREVVVFIGGSN